MQFFLKKSSRCNVHQSLAIKGFKFVKEYAKRGSEPQGFQKFDMLWNLTWASSKRNASEMY